MTDLQPSSSISTISSSQSLSDFIDSIPSTQSSYFHRKIVNDSKLKEKLQLFRIKLNSLIGKMKAERCDAQICLPLQRRYKEINYKHGASNRHQKFWKATQQLIKQQRRINENDFLVGLRKILEGLTKAASTYEYTKEGLIFAGSQLIQRMLQLDKLRIYCIRAMNYYMGFVELGHFLILLLMLVAMAAEISSEANRQIQVLREVYNGLGEYLNQCDVRFPKTSKELPYESEQVKSQERPKEAELILKLANAPAWEERAIVEQYLNANGGLDNVKNSDDLTKVIEAATTTLKQESTSLMTQQFLSLSQSRQNNPSSSSSHKQNTLQQQVKRKGKNDTTTAIFGRKSHNTTVPNTFGISKKFFKKKR